MEERPASRSRLERLVADGAAGERLEEEGAAG
jgi:hypothetical protein